MQLPLIIGGLLFTRLIKLSIMKRMNSVILVMSLLFCGTLEAQVRHLTIEPNHSTIGFDVAIAGGASRVNGKFLESDIELEFVDEDWTKSNMKFTIEAASINTGIEARDDHLRTSDFFDVEQYPNITFISDAITQVGDKQYRASGTFEMHGIQRKMDIPFTETYRDGNTIGVHIETSINRIEFEVGHTFEHTAIPNFLSDEILVRIDFWTKRDKRKE